MSNTTANFVLKEFLTQLAAKQPTPGGGASAAVTAAVGAATAHMSAIYTTRKKDKESGAAEKAETLMSVLQHTLLLAMADEDAKAYTDLQRTWTDADMSPEEKAQIGAKALAVPVKLVETCHQYVHAIDDFLPHCNTNITSDAKVGIHQLAGAARSAYQTVLVNDPLKEEKDRLLVLLKEIHEVENKILD